MLKKLNLQLFGEGGDGGDGGSASATGEGALQGEATNLGIPDRAKKIFEKSVSKNGSSAKTQITNESKPTESTKMTYEDMIKSDDYKEAHKAYMDKTIGDRLKKYKGMEESYGKAKDTLAIIAQKYGVDSNSEDFLEVLNQKVAEDDSYYEDYAMEHDISTEDARKMVTMERKLKAIEAEKEEAQKQEQMRQHLLTLQKHAEETKQRFPNFNLEVEMQDERFRKLCAVNNGDTTSAYIACHWNDIMFNTAQQVSRSAQLATTNAIASGTNRPSENGITPTASSVAEVNFKGMNLAQIRAYADEQRRKGR